MKKALLVFLGVLGLYSAQAQSTFSVADTVRGVANGDGLIEIHNDIVPKGSAPFMKISWKVKSINNLPSTWFNTDNNFGVCDNKNCYLYLGDRAIDDVHISDSIFANRSASKNFKLLIDASAYPSGGPYYITVTIADSSDLTISKDVVFAMQKWPTSVANVNGNNNDDVTVYPNPARSEINVLFNGAANVKNISVYNLIGKVVSVYKVTGNNAKLDLSNMPSGIYFMRLVDASGRIVATRKFTHQ